MKPQPDLDTAPADLRELLARLEDLGLLAQERAAVEAALADIAGSNVRGNSERSSD